MTPELKRALKQLGMTLPEAEAFVRLLKPTAYLEYPTSALYTRDCGHKWCLTPQGRFVAEALVRLGVNGRKNDE